MAEGRVSAAGEDVFEALRKHTSPGAALAARFAGQGAYEVRANGADVELSDGSTVSDFGSYAVPLLGHRPQAVVDALIDQLQTLPTSTRTLTNKAVATAGAELAAYFDGMLPKVYFGTSGADAVEVSTKLARIMTGRSTVLAVKGAFHGKTLGALALTDSPRLRNNLHGLLPGTRHLAPDDPDAVAKACESDPPAALIFEPIQGEGGVRPLSVDVLARWVRDSADAGAFVIADEIQCGLRRAGDRSVALASGLPIDGLLVGKPLGGGVMPVSAALMSEKLYAPMLADPNLHSTTFGGHPLATALVGVTLREIEASVERIDLLARRMGNTLERLRADLPQHVVDVRGRGLMWAIELASPELAGEVLFRLAEESILLSPCLTRPQTLRLLPSVATSVEDIDRLGAVVRAGVTVAEHDLVAQKDAVGGDP